MKVGVVLDEYLPQDGGAYTLQTEVFSTLCRLATESRHQFVIISPKAKMAQDWLAGTGLEWQPYLQPGLLEKVKAFLSRNWPNLRARWRWQSTFERQARRAGIEFIWFLSPRAKEVDLPYMAIVLDLQHRLQPWFPEVSAYGQWETRERHYATFLRRASKIICGTQAGKDEIVQFYQIPEGRIHILPHPTPSYALAAKDLNEKSVLANYGLRPGYLFYPAQFWAHKNHLNLLIAIRQLLDEGLETQLVLSGADFGNRDFVEAHIRTLGLENQVRLLGFVAQADMPALYSAALGLVYLSFFGPENMPPLEAFALGCPVIAADVSGAAEQMGDAALLVDPADSKSIAAGIRKLLIDEKLRSELVARGHKRAASWTAEDFVRSAFGILDSFASIRNTWV